MPVQNELSSLVIAPTGGVGGSATRLRSTNVNSDVTLRDPQAIGDELILTPSRNISDFISRNFIDIERPVIIAGLQFMPLSMPGMQTSTFDSLFSNRITSRNLQIENVLTLLNRLETEKPEVIPKLLTLLQKNNDFLSSFFVAINEVYDIFNGAKNALTQKFQMLKRAAI